MSVSVDPPLIVCEVWSEYIDGMDDLYELNDHLPRAISIENGPWDEGPSALLYADVELYLSIRPEDWQDYITLALEQAILKHRMRP